MSHFRITQASLIAALTWIVGQVVAFVPNFAQYQARAISIGATVITLAFLIANAIHAHGAQTGPGGQ